MQRLKRVFDGLQQFRLGEIEHESATMQHSFKTEVGEGDLGGVGGTERDREGVEGRVVLSRVLYRIFLPREGN